MKISRLEFIPVSIPHTHREVSSQVRQDSVIDLIVKAMTDDGLIGWGESCSGANLESVEEALKAMVPLVLRRTPWESEAGNQAATGTNPVVSRLTSKEASVERK